MQCSRERPSLCACDINQAPLTCCLPLFPLTCLSEGRSWGFYLLHSSPGLPPAFHVPFICAGWQLTVPRLSPGPLLCLITSSVSSCTGRNVQPLTVPRQKFNLKLPGKRKSVFLIHKEELNADVKFGVSFSRGKQFPHSCSTETKCVLKIWFSISI